MSNLDKDPRLVIGITDAQCESVLGYRPPGDILVLETLGGLVHTVVSKSHAVVTFDDDDNPAHITIQVDLKPHA